MDSRSIGDCGIVRYHVTDMTDMKLTYNPDYRVPPGWVLEERLAAMGLSCAEFAEKCDLSEDLIRDIVAGEAPIELTTAGRFQSVLGVDAELWMSLENDYRRGWAHLSSSIERKTILSATPNY